jgi:phthalate 4,5-cis-dihydrodiol dehydrogenase
MPPTLRVGLAGLGVVSRSIMPSIQGTANVQFTAVADIREEALAEASSRYGVQTFNNVAAMCESPNVDAVWIATPNMFHMEHTITAAENRKHVVCEKPMALSLEQAQAMIDAMERNGVRYVQGHSKIYNPPVRTMRRLVREGELGRLIQVNNWYWKHWLSSPRIVTEVDSQYGGGVLYRQGPHQTDVIRGIGGGMVKRVRGTTGRWHPAFRMTESNYTAFLEFEDGTAATMVFNGCGHFDTGELTWGIGEGGQVVDPIRRRPHRVAPVAPEEKYGAVRHAGPEQEADERTRSDRRHQPFYGLTIVSCERGDIRQSPDGLYLYTEEGREEIPIDGGGSRGHAAELEELVAALAEDRPTFPDAHWGRATLEVILAIMESSRLEREVTLSHQVPCLL